MMNSICLCIFSSSISVSLSGSRRLEGSSATALVVKVYPARLADCPESSRSSRNKFTLPAGGEPVLAREAVDECGGSEQFDFTFRPLAQTLGDADGGRVGGADEADDVLAP